jgi:predicted NBD/HSP70 family sugar kinase
MAIWTAKKVNPRIEGELFVVDVEIYKDGVLVKTERFDTAQDQPAEWPRDGIKRLIQRLQAVPELPSKILTGDVTIPADPVPTADEIARDAWLKDFALAQRAKQLVDLNVIAANNARYVALLASLRTNFRPEYIGLI